MRNAEKSLAEAKFKKGQEAAYDPLKREPKYSNAENSPIWELACLARYCHPTVSYWAELMLKGELIEYNGDPLLDFGISNFLDRISYKAPKSAEKIAKFRQSMAKFEKPANEIDFSTQQPEAMRQEEQYLYKYLQMKPHKKPKTHQELVLNEDGEIEDPELEAYAT